MGKYIQLLFLVALSIGIGMPRGFSQGSLKAQSSASQGGDNLRVGSLQRTELEEGRQETQTATLGDSVVAGHVIRNLDKVLAEMKTSEGFAFLHGERRWAIDEDQLIHEQLVALAAQPHVQPSESPSMTDEAYKKAAGDIQLSIDHYQEVESSQSAPETDKVQAQIRLVDLTRQRARLDLAYDNSKTTVVQAIAFQILIATEKKLNDYHNRTEHYLALIDDEISRMLVTDEKTSEFRLWMGASFAALIALVIGGFFALAWTHTAIRESVFSNDRGLQFVTLFVLIIAIVLFGMMNILEGKELSALLGGLSGYILGRSNLGSRPEPKPEKE